MPSCYAFAFGTGDLQFISPAGQVRHNVANGLPPLWYFFEKSCVAHKCNVVTRRLAPQIHYTLRCNIVSVMKDLIWFDFEFNFSPVIFLFKLFLQKLEEAVSVALWMLTQKEFEDETEEEEVSDRQFFNNSICSLCASYCKVIVQRLQARLL